MKKISITIVAIVVALSTLSIGQNIHPHMRRPMGSLADTSKGNFSSIEAGFAIQLPKQIGGFSGVTGIQYSWRLTEGYYVAGIVDRDRKVEGSADYESETLKIVDQTLSGFARDYFATKASIVSVERKDIVYLGHKAIEARVGFPEAVCIVRVFWIGSRAYMVGVLLAGPQSKFEADAMKVIDSLKPMTSEARETLFKKLIQENTPSALPQRPAVKRPKSDAEDRGIKGKVRSVFQESQFVRGSRAGSPREKDSEEYYDEDGYLLKSVEYSDTNGFPREVTVYGYIAGHRVSKSGHIDFESSPGGILIEEPAAVTRRRDNRYHVRYVSRYAPTGERIGYVIYDNAGQILTRTVCKSSLGTTNCTLYDSSGKANNRWARQVDDRGNEVMSIHPDSPVEGWTTKYTYKYEEFDDKGNWSRRTALKFRIFAGIEKEEWAMTEYRQIDYY